MKRVTKIGLFCLAFLLCTSDAEPLVRATDNIDRVIIGQLPLITTETENFIAIGDESDAWKNQ